ncbi:hypothetical protein S83_004040, partial [Arachis hypogaea]
ELVRLGTTSVFANFVKNFTTRKADLNANQPAHHNILENLEELFSNPPFLKPSSSTVDPLDDFDLDLVNFNIKLFDLSLLSTTEIDWLNNYHSQVWEK